MWASRTPGAILMLIQHKRNPWGRKARLGLASRESACAHMCSFSDDALSDACMGDGSDHGCTTGSPTGSAVCVDSSSPGGDPGESSAVSSAPPGKTLPEARPHRPTNWIPPQPRLSRGSTR
eukprot:6206236-Pleurochrysis_carterae.AAC.2